MSTTRVLSSRTHSIASRDLPWLPSEIAKGDLIPEEATATYYRAAGYLWHDGRQQEVDRYSDGGWVVNVHVVGRLAGAKGQPVGDYASSWFIARPGDTHDDREDWPAWLVAWVEAHHPDRGRPDNDPTGSYL